jgi:hypothetical protein
VSEQSEIAFSFFTTPFQALGLVGANLIFYE